MKVGVTESEQALRYKPSLAAVGYVTGLAIAGYFGDRFGQGYAATHSWIGNGDFTDVWSHINNTFDSTMVVGPTALAALLKANKMNLARVTPKKAVAFGVLALSAGLAANAIAETPAMTYSTALKDISAVQEVLPAPIRDLIPNVYHSTADWRDEVYGDASSAAEAALLISAMWGRRRDQLDQQSSQVGPADLPDFTQNLTVIPVSTPKPEQQA
jgi:hypothetical protein